MESKYYKIEIFRCHTSGLFIMCKIDNLTILVMKKRSNFIHINYSGETKIVYRYGKSCKYAMEKMFSMSELPRRIINTLVHFITSPIQKWNTSCINFARDIVAKVHKSKNVLLHVNLYKNELQKKYIEYIDISNNEHHGCISL